MSEQQDDQSKPAEATVKSADTASAAKQQTGVPEKKTKQTEKKGSQKKETRKPAQRHEDKKTPEPARPRSLAAVFALLLAILAVATGAYDYWYLQRQKLESVQLAQQQQDFSQQLASLEQRSNAEREALQQQLRLGERLQAEQASLNAAMQDIAKRLGRTSLAWRLAEVEYLLGIASHRLSLAHDVKTSITILQAADEKIRNIGEPGLLPVRKAIAQEVAALHGVEQADATGMALRLGGLLAQVDDLPLIDKKRIAAAHETQSNDAPLAWRELPLAIWQDLKSLVQVRRQQQAIEPLLPPEQTWFLYQNLRLKLEQARLAVLQRNTDLLRQYLLEADDWLGTFFDQQSAVISAARQSMAELRAQELNPQLPDISRSRRLLHDYLLQQASARPSAKEAAGS